MTKVFINGLSAKSGGGRSILTNFLKVARSADDNFTFVVGVPDAESYAELANERVCLVPLCRWSATALVPFASAYLLPRLALQKCCDIVFNLGDVPLLTKLPQVFLFDWPYAAFLDSPAWHLSTLRDQVIRRAKLFFFKWFLPHVDLIIAQNGAIARQLSHLYKFERLEVIPNAVSLDNVDGGIDYDFALGKGYKLLCLSRYYSHKNIEVFLPLAELIKAAGESIKIFTTISPDDGAGARLFLAELKARGLGGVIYNLGTVPMEHVPSVYQQTDALLLPTLLESFSGTYVEAMFHRKPILTSRLPFAEAVCGKAAYYFNPYDPDEILDLVRKARDDTDERNSRLDEAKALLDDMPNWEETYQAFINAFRTTLAK
jgi:glycosyltransferase involved in cell wall biosynthesis